MKTKMSLWVLCSVLQVVLAGPANASEKLIWADTLFTWKTSITRLHYAKDGIDWALVYTRLNTFDGFQFGNGQSERESYPRERTTEYSLTRSWLHQTRFFALSAGAGLSVGQLETEVKEGYATSPTGPLMQRSRYDSKAIYGMPINATALWNSLTWLGIGLSVTANINNHEPYVFTGLTFAIGKTK